MLLLLIPGLAPQYCTTGPAPAVPFALSLTLAIRSLVTMRWTVMNHVVISPVTLLDALFLDLAASRSFNRSALSTSK